ncbi:MAG: CapA family protein [Bacteroidales bacterium]|nr:CapA family protein [Bacteroidales bacterium]
MNLLSLCFSLLSFLVGVDSPGEPVTAELLFVGDAMQHQGQLDQALIKGDGKNYVYDDCFRFIAPTIMEADYAVCNLEVPLGGGRNYSGYPCFSAPDAYAKALKDAGFDMFLTANNHCLDRSDKGLRRTLTALDSLGVDHIGTYYNAQQRDTLVPFIKSIKGIRVGFLNYTYGTNGINPRSGAEVSLIDKEKMKAEIAETREAGAELIVVCMHWGVEYVLTENAEQRQLAQFLIDQGVDMIIGSHPHVIQPMKIVVDEATGKRVPVVYSLGNFISNMKIVNGRGGALVRCRIERAADGKARFVEANYDTFFTVRPVEGATDYIVVPSWMSDHIPSAQRPTWNAFNRAAQDVFEKYNIDFPRLHH